MIHLGFDQALTVALGLLQRRAEAALSVWSEGQELITRGGGEDALEGIDAASTPLLQFVSHRLGLNSGALKRLGDAVLLECGG
eukprot:scaffold7028_cov28-Tisochrysis_lutea.AAC.3